MFVNLIIHHSPLTERKEHMLKQMNYHHVTLYEFIEHEYANKIPSFINITVEEQSLFLKHINAIHRAIIKRIYVVNIFEDDAVLSESFIAMYMRLMKEVKVGWDVLFLGACVGMHVNNVDTQRVLYRMNRSRGACMYVLNYDSCVKLLMAFNRCSVIDCPFDHWLNEVIEKMNLVCYWSEPVLVEQGSELGLFKSSLNRLDS